MTYSDLFSEVHFVSPAATEIEASTVQPLVGTAKLVIHPLGSHYYNSAWLPFRTRSPARTPTISQPAELDSFSALARSATDMSVES